MKHLALITTFFLATGIFGQNLISTSFDLNPGGYVADVAYFEPTDSYIIVGNFTSINGVPRHHIAFLNGSLTALQSYNPILSSDDYFQTIAVYQNRIFIGGNFSSLSENNSLYAGSLGSTSCIFEIQYNQSISNLEFVNRNWNIASNTAPYTPSGVNDLEVYGDSLLIAGSFYSTALPILYNLAHFDLTTNSFDGNFASPTQGSTDQIFNIEKAGNKLYLSGQTTPNGTAFGRVLENGLNDNSFNPNLISANSPIPFYFYSTIHQESQTILCAVKHNSYAKFGNYDLSGNIQFTPNLPTLSGEIADLNTYKTKILRAQIAHGFIYGYDYQSNTLSSDWDLSINSTAFNTMNHPKRILNVCQNYLFISSSGLSNLNGQVRQGLAIICMEPYYMTNFVNYETSACAGKTIQYSIDSVKYARGYHWSYSGNGATIGGTDISNGGANFIGEDKNDVNITFGPSFSPGHLTVRAFSSCGELTTDSTTIFINQATLPQFSPLNDTAITCYSDSIQLLSNPTSAFSSLGWYDFQNQFVANGNIIASNSGTYVFELTGNSGCKNYDTVIVSIDTLSPSHEVNINYGELNCTDTNLVLLTYSSTPNTVSYWNSSSTDSLLISSPGNYTSVSVDTLNGCADSSYTLIVQNYDPPEFQIDQYNNLSSFGYLDTINCIDSILYLVAQPYDSLHNSYWTNDFGINLGDSAIIQSDTTLQLYSKNISSGCEEEINISIFEDLSAPNYSLSPSLQTSCSNDSTILDAEVYSLASNYFWIDPFGIQFADSTWINATGTYYFHIQDQLNGCSSVDSINLDYNPVIEFIEDSIQVCPSSKNTIHPNPIYQGNLNYLWEDGSVDSIFQFFGTDYESLNLLLYNDDSSCYGNIQYSLIPNATPQENFLITAPCGNGNNGSVFAATIGGVQPFQYSIDQPIWQSSPHFDSLSLGNHKLWIQDALGCLFEYDFNISDNSSQPEVNFLVATYNEIEDSIYIDPILFPEPDSLNWTFDGNPYLISNPLEDPILIYPDTGSFDIQMTAFINNCQYSKVKTVQISPIDTNDADLNNLAGIKSFAILPNPTSDQVQIDVEFYKSQACSIELRDPFGNLIQKWNFPKSLFTDYSFSLQGIGISSGFYYLVVNSEFDSCVESIIYQ